MGESWRKIRLILTADVMFLYQPYFVSQRLFQLPSNWLCSWFELATLIERKAHVGNIKSIVAQITLTMCLLRFQKNFNSVSMHCLLQYITTHDFKQIHIIVSLITLLLPCSLASGSLAAAATIILSKIGKFQVPCLEK